MNLRMPGYGSVAEHFGALSDLVTAGLVRHLGVSNVDADQLAEARTVAPVVCVQNRFSLDWSDPASTEVLRRCAEQAIAFVPFFAIAGAGRERGATTGDAPVVRDIAADRGVTAAQVRLAWTLGQGSHVLAIPGTGNLEHLEQNVAAASLHLTDAGLARLDSLRAQPEPS